MQCFLVTQEGYLRLAEALGPSPLQLSMYLLPVASVSRLTGLNFGPLATQAVATNKPARQAFELVTSLCSSDARRPPQAAAPE